MSTISKPYTFSPNTSISSSQMNANFDTLYNDYNGGISAANLATDAVTTAKIADANVTTAKLADDAVTAAKIDFGGAGAGVWWEEIGRTTLGSAGDTITVSNIPTRRYLKVLVTLIDTGGTIGATMSLNNDSGSNYARVQATDFGSPSTQTSNGPLILGTGNVACNQYIIVDIQNIASEEKIFEWIALLASTAGAGNAPTARRAHGKWANTTDAISRIDITNPGAGDFAVGSEIVVLGHN